jgi:surface antigen
MHLLAALIIMHTIRVTPWPSALGSMGGIARTEHVSLAALERANPQVRNPNRIYVGQLINIPASGSSSGEAAPVTLSVRTTPVSAGSSLNHYPWGYCTWGAAHLAHDNVDGLGNAWHWIYGARARGLPTGTVPRVGATVVFQPGVQYAGSSGHVAHVVAVNGSSFRIEEMNSYGWGGGFGRFSYRWAHIGPGVTFIY